MKFIIIIVIVLVIIVAAQLMKVYELSSRLRNKSEADITPSETKFNAGMLLFFYLALMISSTYLFIVYGARPGLGPSASEHGESVDFLYDANWIIILIVFYITQTLLFGFAIKYQQKKGRKAVFFSHSTKLELVWTVIPAITLAGIIIGGLMVWNKITTPPENAEVIEIYAKQFGWTARYAGADNQLGNAHVRLIDGANTLGVDFNDTKSFDDVITQMPEMHLPVGKTVTFKFRSQDVIHSAYLPHFRVQMNCVPGTNTHFSFKPTVTTADIRKEELVIQKVKNINEIRAARGDDPYEYDYILLCNKICGAAHYNMQMKVVVETQEEFDKWMSEQKSFAEML